MSIEFERGDLPELGRMEMTCDFPDCKVTDYFDGDFRECVSQAKEHGWHIFKASPDEWEHYCPEHAKEAADKEER